ncbi:tetratricopeptide repeat protein [Lipingzhangella sp. LS1_29]|uniref:Tetratricopeptide repeat protein n=1 Tax=Lipingzhangella rawalii TaxID=2055835 RepID=A0ABU2HBP2_9ACTN|nr:tetratricopeptide repeat protein [Lipingzhangella rawalii]MDS1272210.1 tetratricopeptide repeat protein [Lipingzhangella rawalii]
MSSPEPGAPQRSNRLTGTVHGTAVQVNAIHGGLHLHAATTHSTPAPGPDVQLDPPCPPHQLRGRDALLTEITNALDHGTPQPHIIVGPGGIGKSTLAAALAQWATNQGWSVFWVRPGDVATALVQAAIELGAPAAEAAQLHDTPRRAARWVWRHLHRAPVPWLLVFDNADRPAELDPDHPPGQQVGWLRGSTRGCVLVTSRVDDPQLWAPAVPHRLGPLDPEAATAILTDHVPGTEPAGARALAQRLHGLPLALRLAGSAMATHRVLFPDCTHLLEHLSDTATRLDRIHTPAVGGTEDPRQALSSTWAVSMELLQPVPQAEPLLRLLSVFGADGAEVPLRRLSATLLHNGPVDNGSAPLDELTVAGALNALAVHGLVTLEPESNPASVRVHPLIAETVRSALGTQSVEIADEAERVLHAHRDRDPLVETRAFNAVYRLRSATQGSTHPATLRSRLQYLRSLLVSQDPATADAGLSALVSDVTTALGDAHPLSLAVRHHWADALLSRGRLHDAGRQYRHVLAARERTLGPTHEDTCDTRHQLALVALHNGDLDTAEARLHAVVRTDGRHSEPGSFARQNLALVALFRGHTDVAWHKLRAVLAARENRLGDEHPDTVLVRFQLATVARRRGDLETAADGFARAAAAWQHLLGPEHPDTRAARRYCEELHARLRTPPEP